MHVAAPEAVEYVPAAHSVHVTAPVPAPAFVIEPALQVMHAPPSSVPSSGYGYSSTHADSLRGSDSRRFSCPISTWVIAPPSYSSLPATAASATTSSASSSTVSSLELSAMAVMDPSVGGGGSSGQALLQVAPTPRCCCTEKPCAPHRAEALVVV